MVIIFVIILLLSVASAIPGVHTPLTINPIVDIPDSQWLLDIYQIIFGRVADPVGLRDNFQDLQSGLTRDALYNAFVTSQEFKNNPALSDRSNFIIRSFRVLLIRNPSQSEIAFYVARIHGPHGEGPGDLTWIEMINAFYASNEYKSHCPTQYYTLGSQVKPTSFLLSNLFNNTARLQVSTESQLISLSIPSAKVIWDQKLSVFINPNSATDGFPYISWTRAYNGNMFTMVGLRSNDAVNFVETAPLFNLQPGQTFYDGHVTLDYTYCPPRYVMAMECIGHGGAASLCTSFSTYPSRPETWSNPFILVDGCNGGKPAACGTQAAESASTGVLLVDGYNKYAAWTQVYDGVRANDPLAHTYSQSTGPIPSFFSYYGTVISGHPTGVSSMMNSEPHPFCTDAWDCNNRDKQDWKREGNYFYALYNGANYYRCDGRWGISVARSTAPVGPEYTDRLPLSRGIPAVVSNTCGASYPVLNVIDGELFVYYAFRNVLGAPQMLRSRIVRI